MPTTGRNKRCHLTMAEALDKRARAIQLRAELGLTWPAVAERMGMSFGRLKRILFYYKDR